MSTDYQRYPIENQAAAIAAYAQAHNISIVRTYRDGGESGLTLTNRLGLIQLLNDIQSDRADYGHILIYDVSRWGRFQDIDESAYYEFICKQGGVKVCYCAKQFENDGSLVSSVVKNIKKVNSFSDWQARACTIISMARQLRGRYARSMAPHVSPLGETCAAVQSLSRNLIVALQRHSHTFESC